MTPLHLYWPSSKLRTALWKLSNPRLTFFWRISGPLFESSISSQRTVQHRAPSVERRFPSESTNPLSQSTPRQFDSERSIHGTLLPQIVNRVSGNVCLSETQASSDLTTSKRPSGLTTPPSSPFLRTPTPLRTRNCARSSCATAGTILDKLLPTTS